MSFLGSLVEGFFGNEAADRAADTQVDISRDNIALIREMYEDGVARQQPFLDAQMGFLGISPGNNSTGNNYVGTNALSQYNPAGGGGYNRTMGIGNEGGRTSPNYAQYVNDSPDLIEAYNRPEIQQRFGSPEAFGQFHYQQFGQNEPNRNLAAFGQQPATPYAQGGGAASTGGTDYYQQALDSPFGRSMLETTDADFDRIRGGLGAGGTSLSGSAVKALDDRAKQNTNTAISQYWNALGGGSVNAANIAGQGTQMAQNVSGQNQNIANARGSSYLTQGANNGAAASSGINALASFFGGGF